MYRAIVLLRFVFIFVLLGSHFSQPMDGLNENFNIQEDVIVKTKRKKKSFSKIFAYLCTCLCDGSHTHMLRFCDVEKMRFQIILLNKKSPLWQENAISFCKGLDALSNKMRSKEKYEEKTRGRLRANMSKLCGKYMKLVDDQKDPENLCKRTITYEIIHPYYIDKVKNKLREKSSEMTNMNASKNILSNSFLDNLNSQHTVIIENPDTLSIMKKSEGDCRLKRKKKDSQSKSQVTPRKKRKDFARKHAGILSIADLKNKCESNVDTTYNISENRILSHVINSGTGENEVWCIQNTRLMNIRENKGNLTFNELNTMRKQANFNNQQCESSVGTMQNISANKVLQHVSDSGNYEDWFIQNESLMNIGGNEKRNQSYNEVQGTDCAEINDQCVFPFVYVEEHKSEYIDDSEKGKHANFACTPLSSDAVLSEQFNNSCSKGNIESMYDDDFQHEISQYFRENQEFGNLESLFSDLDTVFPKNGVNRCDWFTGFTRINSEN